MQFYIILRLQKSIPRSTFDKAPRIFWMVDRESGDKLRPTAYVASLNSNKK